MKIKRTIREIFFDFLMEFSFAVIFIIFAVGVIITIYEIIKKLAGG
jgi:hypothetical protein